jgi:hypothetical protein
VADGPDRRLGPVKFRVHHDPIRERVLVYCEVNPDPEATERMYLTRSEPPEVHKVGLGEEPPLWDWFPYEVVGALAEALDPRPVATERHLDDAIAIRDRLLTLIEQTTTRS